MKKPISLRIFSLALLILFAGCSLGNSEPQDQELAQKVMSERALKRDAFLELKLLSASTNTVDVSVVLHNPSKQKLQSVRTWVSFPPTLLKGEKITFAEKNPFTLMAPGENAFDAEHGLAKIGGSIDPALSSSEILTLATLHFTRLRNEPAALAFFDQRAEGHTQALISYDNALRSILEDKSATPLVLQKSE